MYVAVVIIFSFCQHNFFNIKNNKLSTSMEVEALTFLEDALDDCGEQACYRLDNSPLG